MRHASIIEPTESGSSGYVPDLPGCIAAGTTADEVRSLLDEAVRLHIAALQESGDPVPPASTACNYVAASGSAS